MAAAARSSAKSSAATVARATGGWVSFCENVLEAYPKLKGNLGSPIVRATWEESAKEVNAARAAFWSARGRLWYQRIATLGQRMDGAKADWAALRAGPLKAPGSIPTGDAAKAVIFGLEVLGCYYLGKVAGKYNVIVKAGGD
eukprot:PLAT10853.1.p2 GENE.PLAT10853.1~~PLAT10853.1.p2  ORF type:complete len:142 (+),score=63.35 PLAT10853.1:70-495(+)